MLKELILTTKNKNKNIKIKFHEREDGYIYVLEKIGRECYDAYYTYNKIEDEGIFEKFCFLYMEDYAGYDGIINVLEKNFDFICDSYSFYYMFVGYNNRFTDGSFSKICYDDYKELGNKLGENYIDFTNKFEDEMETEVHFHSYQFRDFAINLGKRIRKIK